MLVKDVMTKKPITIEPKATILEATDLMKKNNIKKLPVLDKSGALVGIITENDLQKAAPSQATTLDMYELTYLLSKLTVEKTMTKDVKTVTFDETVEEAARIMADGDFGCLPVMKDNLLVGIITDSDLFRMFIEMFSARTSGVRAIVQMSDEPGSLSIFTQKIAMAGGIIISCITTEAENPAFRKVTVKATNIALNTCKEICEQCGTVEDIREV